MQLQVLIASRIKAINPTARKLMRLLKRSCLPPQHEFAVETALREALANAIVHGNHHDPSKKVRVRCGCDAVHGLWIAVRDEGAGFDPAVLESPVLGENLASDHGRGLLLIRRYMDEVRFEDRGREIFMRKSGSTSRQTSSTDMNEQDQNDTPAITVASRGCVELWAGSELAHRHIQLVGLEADVLSVPCAAQEGGDLYAFFSCAADREARILLADCVGHGHEASVIASYIHGLIRRHRDILDNSRFLSALNDEFAHPGQTPEAPLRLSTFITATFDQHTGEFNYAYAAHPRMFLWQARYRRWFTLDGLEGFPVGAFAGSAYTQQSIHVEPADIILMFSDGATDVLSPDDEMLTVEGLLELASRTLEKLPVKFPLALFVTALAEAIRDFHGSGDLEDDLTLLALRRSSLVSASS